MRWVSALRAASTCAASCSGPIRLYGRFENPHLPDHGSHGADPLVIGVAREIVATRPGGLGRRQQAGGAGNELPCAKLCPFTDRDPHETRPLGLRDILQLNQPQEQPLPVLAILDGFDEARDRRDDDAVENGRRDAAGPDGAGSETGKDGGKGNRRGQRPYAAAQDEGADAGDRERPNGRPEGRCPVGLEEQEDADPEAHGDPGKQPALLDLPGDGPREPAAPVDKAPVDAGAPGPRQSHRPRCGARDPAGLCSVVFHRRFGLTRVALHARASDPKVDSTFGIHPMPIL